MPRAVRTLARFASLLLLTGCLDSIEPETGPLLQAPCSDEDSDPETDVSFREDVYLGIFSRPEIDCVRCHTPAGATPIGFAETGFDITTLGTLRLGGSNSGVAIVIESEPCSSLLVQKVSVAPPVGSRMPLAGPPYLSETDEQLLRDWIAEGARDN